MSCITIGEEASSESANRKPDNRPLKVELGGWSCVPVTYRSPGGDDNGILTSLNPLQVIGRDLAESHKQTVTHYANVAFPSRAANRKLDNGPLKVEFDRCS